MAVTKPNVAPIILKDIDLIFGVLTAGVADFTNGVNYSKHVDQVEFSPKTQPQTWAGLGGNTHSDQSMATWDVTIRYAQDWDTAGSLSTYLYDNEGLKVPVQFRPRSGVGSTFTANVTLSPGSVGGQGNQLGTPTSVTLGCDGKPVRTPGA